MSVQRAIEAAIHRHLEETRLVVACVTNQRPVALPDASTNHRSFLLRFARSIPLRHAAGGASGLRFDVRQTLANPSASEAFRESRQIEIQRYEYRLLDHDERELLVYHWHLGAAGAGTPHLHISSSLDALVDARTRREIALDKLHIVTGHVPLRAVVRMLITEFRIRPLRDDWAERLAEPSAH